MRQYPMTKTPFVIGYFVIRHCWHMARRFAWICLDGLSVAAPGVAQLPPATQVAPTDDLALAATCLDRGEETAAAAHLTRHFAGHPDPALRVPPPAAPALPATCRARGEETAAAAHLPRHLAGHPDQAFVRFSLAEL